MTLEVVRVMSGLLPGSRHEIRRTRDLEEGRRLNRFLNKWLRYCLRQGHGFTGRLQRRHLNDPLRLSGSSNCPENAQTRDRLPSYLAQAVSVIALLVACHVHNRIIHICR